MLVTVCYLQSNGTALSLCLLDPKNPLALLLISKAKLCVGHGLLASSNITILTVLYICSAGSGESHSLSFSLRYCQYNVLCYCQDLSSILRQSQRTFY
jgi:hypothetical protein